MHYRNQMRAAAMIKDILTTTIVVLGTFNLCAQPGKSVFAELGGNGVFISVNYDARFSSSEKGFGFRIGIGFFPPIEAGFAATSSALTIPVGINYLVGKGPNYFESGLGATYLTTHLSVFGGDPSSASGVGFIPTVGYRYAPLGKALQIRVFVSPIIGSGGTLMWAGVSIGYKF